MEGNWSDWSTTKPTGVADEYIETQQRYRTRNKLTTTGTSNTMSGWTLSGSEKVWSDYGSWSDWSTDAVSASRFHTGGDHNTVRVLLLLLL